MKLKVIFNFTVHQDDLLSLAGRAAARRSFPELGFVDPAAEQLARALEVEARAWEPRELRASVARAMVSDALVCAFLERHPDAVVVSVHGGLGSRFARVDNGRARFIELDTPDLAAVKRDVLAGSERHVIATSCSLACVGWMDCARAAVDVPLLVVAEAGIRRAGAAAMDGFLGAAAARLARGTEIVVEHDGRAPLRTSGGARGVLELPLSNGGLARFPTLRAVSPSTYDARVRDQLVSSTVVSRLFAGRSPAVLHACVV